MAALKLVVAGVTGRMGQALVRLIGEADGLEPAGGIASEPVEGAAAERYGVARVYTPAQAGALIEAADVVVDFSSPAGLTALLDGAGEALAARALVTGTTGLDPAVERQLDTLAADAPVFAASNFSIGVHVLARLVERAARLLGGDRYDIEIVEAHHGRKVDAPSGTALTLAEAAARGRGASLEKVRRDGRSGEVGARPAGEIGLHAVRGGGVIGEHHVHLLGALERIELSHVALDRSLFAAGALEAARWVAAQPPGRYGMADMLADEEG